MILAFEFEYLSENGILESLLGEICQDFGISFTVGHENHHVTLLVEDNEEILGKFADFLGEALPLSIFFKSSSVYVAEKFPEIKEKSLASHLPITFTPKRLKNSELSSSNEYLLPSIDFKTSKDSLNLKTPHTMLCASDAPSLEKLYDTMAEMIAKGECIALHLACGEYVLGNIEAIGTLKDSSNMEVIATDLSMVERMVVIRENEIKALATLERPAIRCKVNAIYAQKNILPLQRVYIRLADELWMHHLCRRLFAQGVQFLFRAPLSSASVDVQTVLESTAKLNALKPLRICVLENGEIVIVEGNSFASQTLLENHQKFAEPSHATFVSILQEHQLFEVKTTCFYLSKTHDDKIMNYSKEHGILDLTRVSIPLSFESLFERIEKSSESATRLVENYKTHFPEIYEKAINTAIPENSPKSIFTLWKIASVVFGFSQEFEKAGDALVELAEDFGGQKGPRMDYFLQKEDTLASDFDYIRLLRSGMSFKLAGVDDATLSFGYVQSLAYFIADSADSYKESFESANIALSGGLFGYRRLTEMVYKNLKPNHHICLNLELPLECDA